MVSEDLRQCSQQHIDYLKKRTSGIGTLCLLILTLTVMMRMGRTRDICTLEHNQKRPIFRPHTLQAFVKRLVGREGIHRTACLLSTNSNLRFPRSTTYFGSRRAIRYRT